MVTFALGLVVGLTLLIYIVAMAYSVGGTDDEGVFDE